VETPFLVDLGKIQEENFKLTVLQDYTNATSSHNAKGFRGSNITMASSFLGASLGPSAHQHGQGADGAGSGSSHGSSVVSSGGLSKFSRAQGQQRVVRSVLVCLPE
jgi:hypothetical protein